MDGLLYPCEGAPQGQGCGECRPSMGRLRYIRHLLGRDFMEADRMIPSPSMIARRLAAM